MKQFYVYITASKKNGTIYIGKANDLINRVGQHRQHAVAGFTDRYDVTRLVHYEVLDSMEAALARERQLKAWKRQWKLELIEKNNPDWRDLWEDIVK